MDLRLNGRTAFVAGATGGLGLACARALAAEGVRVAVVGRREQRAKEVADEIGSGAIAVTADLADPDSRAAAISVVRAEFGQVDILILNGGGPPPGSATDLSASDAEAAVASLVLPHVDLVRAFLPAMTERRWGRIIAVGSSGVQQPIARLAASNLGRAALAGYLKTLAGEVAADGVTVNMVLPGRIDTDRV
uniref:SDR family NAD(P)-dependent oxidoreductase n=1 Tax=uncultured Aeromicrobium sp. TaxID=337820 RepID=UPI0025CDC271